MKAFPDTHTIEAWLSGTLSEEESHALAKLEQTDAEFAELVAYHRLAYQAIEAGLGQQLKQQLQALNPSQVHSQIQTQVQEGGGSLSSDQSTIRPFWQRATVWSIAAAVVLLIVVSARMLYTHTDQAIAHQFAEAYAAPPVRGELGPEEIVNQGLEAYQDERYAGAIDFFSQLPEDHPRYVEMRFYLGNAALQISKSQQAIQEFQLVLSKKDVRFAPAAEWYLALAYLQDGQLQKTRRVASRLADNEGSAYQDEAVRLLGKLDSPWRW